MGPLENWPLYRNQICHSGNQILRCSHGLRTPTGSKSLWRSRPKIPISLDYIILKTPSLSLLSIQIQYSVEIRKLRKKVVFVRLLLKVGSSLPSDGQQITGVT